MKYPADLIDGNGVGKRIHVGHGLDRAELAADYVHAVGENDELAFEEVSLRFIPRIKNCENRFGWGCDSDGEWHSHWEDVAAGAGTAYTVVGPVTLSSPGDTIPS